MDQSERHGYFQGEFRNREGGVPLKANRTSTVFHQALQLGEIIINGKVLECRGQVRERIPALLERSEGESAGAERLMYGLNGVTCSTGVTETCWEGGSIINQDVNNGSSRTDGSLAAIGLPPNLIATGKLFDRIFGFKQANIASCY